MPVVESYTKQELIEAVHYGLNYDKTEGEYLTIPEDNIREWLNSNILRTAEEWQKLNPEIKVLGNEGWTKKSWYEEAISYNEYVERRNNNTCIKSKL